MTGGDWARVGELRPALSAEEWAAKYEDNPPVELLEVGKPYWQEGCSGAVVPCLVKLADGKRQEIKLVTDVRYEGGEMRPLVAATWGRARVVEDE